MPLTRHHLTMLGQFIYLYDSNQQDQGSPGNPPFAWPEAYAFFSRKWGLPAISFQGTVFHLPNHMNVHKDNSNLESKTLRSTYRKKIQITSYKILSLLKTSFYKEPLQGVAQ